MRRAAEAKELAQRKLDLENAEKRKTHIKWLQEDRKAQADIKKAKEAEAKRKDQAELEAALMYEWQKLLLILVFVVVTSSSSP